MADNLPAVAVQEFGDASPIKWDADGGMLVLEATGEFVALADASDGALIHAAYGLDYAKRELERYRKSVTRELLDRMDRGALWTMHTRLYGQKVTATAPSTEPERVVDKTALYAALIRLVRKRVITKAAADAACKREVAFKASIRGIDALLKLGGEVAEKVNACIVQVPKEDRRVTVKEG
jgi:hypothetical protein